MKVELYPWPGHPDHIIVLVEGTTNGTRGQVGSFASDVESPYFYEYAPLRSLSNSEQMDVRFIVANEIVRLMAIREVTARLKG